MVHSVVIVSLDINILWNNNMNTYTSIPDTFFTDGVYDGELCRWNNGESLKDAYISWIENPWLTNGTYCRFTKDGCTISTGQNSLECSIPTDKAGIGRYYTSYVPKHKPDLKSLLNTGDYGINRAYEAAKKDYRNGGCLGPGDTCNINSAKDCAGIKLPDSSSAGCWNDRDIKKAMVNSETYINTSSDVNRKLYNAIGQEIYNGIAMRPGSENFSIKGELGNIWQWGWRSFKAPRSVNVEGSLKYFKLEPVLGGDPQNLEIKITQENTTPNYAVIKLEHYVVGEAIKPKPSGLTGPKDLNGYKIKDTFAFVTNESDSIYISTTQNPEDYEFSHWLKRCHGFPNCSICSGCVYRPIYVAKKELVVNNTNTEEFKIWFQAYMSNFWGTWAGHTKLHYLKYSYSIHQGSAPQN